MQRLASGRTADVFALGDGRVLRRYRQAWDVTREAAVMAYVGRHGFPVPAVHRAEGPDLVMERVDGPTMLTALAAGTLDAVSGMRMLADLHAVPARPGTPDGQCVVHLDLHPDNVMLTAGGPVVVDWSNATDGPADLDLAVTALILAEVAVDPAQPYAALAGAGLPLFLEAAGGSPERGLDGAFAMRAANPTLSADEKSRLARAVSLVRNRALAVRGASATPDS